mmetsp:Transcript_23594/g.41764  ORF Transcript_23594/g.41764 Transcript_23594/m.41764 type:complete len:285 (+) Transcript_23594:432-1286(+)
MHLCGICGEEDLFTFQVAVDALQFANHRLCRALRFEIQQSYLAQCFGDVYCPGVDRIAISGDQIFGAHANIDLTPHVLRQGRHGGGGRAPSIQRNCRGLAGAGDLAGEEVHRWRADELRNKLVFGTLIELQRCANLGNAASSQHDDACGQRHGLHLIVGHIDHGAVGHGLFELGDLDTRGDTKGCVKVRERFVKQIDLGVAHNGTSDGHTLTLTTGELFGQSIQQVVQLERFGSFLHTLVDFRRAHLGDFERKRHVFAHSEVRIERVGLEHHRDAAFAGRDIIY